MWQSELEGTFNKEWRGEIILSEDLALLDECLIKSSALAECRVEIQSEGKQTMSIAASRNTIWRLNLSQLSFGNDKLIVMMKGETPETSVKVTVKGRLGSKDLPKGEEL